MDEYESLKRVRVIHDETIEHLCWFIFHGRLAHGARAHGKLRNALLADRREHPVLKSSPGNEWLIMENEISFWQHDIPTGKVIAIVGGTTALFVFALLIELLIAPVKAELERQAACSAALEYMTKVTRREFVSSFTHSREVLVPLQIRDASCGLFDKEASLSSKTTSTYESEASLDEDLSGATPYTVNLVKDGGTWRVTGVYYGEKEKRVFHQPLFGNFYWFTKD